MDDRMYLQSIILITRNNNKLVFAIQKNMNPLTVSTVVAVNSNLKMGAAFCLLSLL